MCMCKCVCVCVWQRMCGGVLLRARSPVIRQFYYYYFYWKDGKIFLFEYIFSVQMSHSLTIIFILSFYLAGFNRPLQAMP